MSSNTVGGKRMVTIIPVTISNRMAYAVVDATTGLWGHTKSGNASFSYTYDKCKEIAVKAVSFTEVPPPGFTAFGHPGTGTVKPVVVPTPAPRQSTPEGDCDGEAKKARTVKQATAWLAVCESNLTRFKNGEFRGGELSKYEKAVTTAKDTLAAAQQREGSTVTVNDNDSN
jgi:hypothetical protein